MYLSRVHGNGSIALQQLHEAFIFQSRNAAPFGTSSFWKLLKYAWNRMRIQTKEMRLSFEY